MRWYYNLSETYKAGSIVFLYLTSSSVELNKHLFTWLELDCRASRESTNILQFHYKTSTIVGVVTTVSVNISFPSCISLIAVSLSFVAVSIFFFSFVAVSIFFFSYSISVIAVYPLILSKDLNYCLGLGLKGSDYDD